MVWFWSSDPTYEYPPTLTFFFNFIFYHFQINRVILLAFLNMM